MNFDLDWTPEQLRFQAEVRSWLAANVPDIPDHADPAALTAEEYAKQRALGRALGAKGWLYPSMPAEYGGGGMPFEMAMIIEEELDRYHMAVPPYYDTGGRLGAASILVWGTDEQKEFFLPRILTGQVRTWQLLSEPESGSDLASVTTTAVRDGDAYVVNGTKIFVGSAHGAEYSWMIVRTDPAGERHHNLSWLMVPMDLPGITVEPMDLLLVGGERGAASGRQEHGHVRGRARARVQPGRGREQRLGGRRDAPGDRARPAAEHGPDRRVARIRDDVRAGDDPRRSAPCPRTRTCETCSSTSTSSRRSRVCCTCGTSRTARPGGRLTYEAPQAYLQQKRSALSKARAILDIMGPRALVDDPEWAVADGHVEVHQRASIVEQHPGGNCRDSTGNHRPPAGDWPCSCRGTRSGASRATV